MSSADGDVSPPPREAAAAAAAAGPAGGEAAGEMTPVERDIETIREGLRLLLTNKFEDADRHWNEALARTKTRKFNPGEYDPSGPFAFVGALTALLYGLATLQNDQLTTALEKLQKADELANASKDWAGKTVIKGLCMLLMGIVQTLQGSKTQGIWLVLRSWLWLRLLEAEALNYEGPERSLVRSSALLSLGIFNLILSLLPPILTRTASWCSGLQGSRETAMEFLRLCWQEDGLLAPFAVICLVGYQVDVRTWLGEPHAEEPFQEANRALEWAEQRFPGGIFFEGLRANYCAVNRDLVQALEYSNRLSSMAQEMPALGLVMHAKAASYAQAGLDWPEAARAFRQALEVYRKVGRRSLVPAMAANAALCHELAGEVTERDEMMDLVLEYKAREDKKTWDMPDKNAFAMAAKCKDGTWEPRMELFTLMVLRHRSTMFMSPAKIETMLGMLRTMADDGDGADRKAKSILLQAEILRQSSRFEEAITASNLGLELQGKISKDMAKLGCMQYLQYIIAASQFHLGKLAEAQHALKKLDAAPRNHQLYYSILFKTTQLSRRLGVETKDTYLEVTVPSRDQIRFEAKLPEGTAEVEWDFTLDDFSISFTAYFEPEGAQGKGSKTMLQSLDQYEATVGPASGRFEPPGPGTLVLTFDNKFSMMRSKKLLVRVLPEHLILTSSKT